MGYRAQQANSANPVTASMDRRGFPELAYTAVAMGLLLPFALSGQSAPIADYWAYVANESSDIVSLIRFGDDGFVEEKTITVGLHPADLDGAHGVSVSPDGAHWYVSLAHGTPYGKIWKFETGSSRFVFARRTTIRSRPRLDHLSATPRGNDQQVSVQLCNTID